MFKQNKILAGINLFYSIIYFSEFNSLGNGRAISEEDYGCDIYKNAYTITTYHLLGRTPVFCIPPYFAHYMSYSSVLCISISEQGPPCREKNNTYTSSHCGICSIVSLYILWEELVLQSNYISLSIRYVNSNSEPTSTTPYLTCTFN